MPGTYLNHYQDHLERIAEYSDLVTRLQNVDATLAQIETDIANIPGGGGGSAGSVITVSASQLVAPLILDSRYTDLMYLLGAIPTGFANPHPLKIVFTSDAPPTTGGLTVPTNRGGNNYASQNLVNSWIMLDVGSGKSINLSALGVRSRVSAPSQYPLRLIIEGSNDNVTFTQIYDWNNIGFTALAQERYASFTQSFSYRYIKIRQPGLNGDGTNVLAFNQLYFFGTLTITS